MQYIDPHRYLMNPRTAIFVREDGRYLLMKGSPAKGWWAGKYNGLGGHIERGEDVLSAARRELHEETGLTANLWLAGTIAVDRGELGILLFVFLGEQVRGDLIRTDEGDVGWIAESQLADLPVVDDLPVLIDRFRGMTPNDPPFAARSFYEADGRLTVEFSK